jgi:hypothetical protein
MPKLRSETFRVRASTKGYATLDFTDNRGRTFQIEFPSEGLPLLAAELQEAAAGAPLYRESVQLGPTSQNSKQSGHRLVAHDPATFQPGPHGAFQFGTSADHSSVVITVHVPTLGAIDFVLDPSTAKAVEHGLAGAIAFVERSQTGDQTH